MDEVPELTQLEAKRREWLTVSQVCEELDISPRTWDRMRASGTAPRCKRMGQGNRAGLRIRRDWLDEWAERDEEDTA